MNYSMLRTFLRSKSAVASVEFALIAPVLIFAFITIFVAADALRAKRSAHAVTSTMTDLITRSSSIDLAQYNVIQSAGEALLGRYNSLASDTVIVTTSVINPIDNQDILEVQWSVSSVPGMELQNNDLMNIEFPDIAEGDSIILVTTNFKYAPIVAGAAAFEPFIELDSLTMRRPRFVRAIEFVNAP